MPLDRPIPAFYCCYLLRSTVSRASVYVGSTPNPVRRLKQHNGLVKGGAVRTSRGNLRPWEMACIVAGFPSHIAALQFEWAWQNPHVTTHIAPEERLQTAAGKKRSGHPKRPRHSISSLISNLHLLLRAPSFSRWPLEIRFFSRTVYNAWVRWTKSANEPIRGSIRIIQDFSESKSSGSDVDDTEAGTANSMIYRRMSDLPIDYKGQKLYVEKAKDVIDFEREGSCKICNSELEHGSGLYILCPTPDCETVTHIGCLSNHFMKDEEEELVPIKGNCPSCKTQLLWVDLVKELSLRMRGQKEVQRLLAVKKVRKEKAGRLGQTVIESSDGEQDSEPEIDMDGKIGEYTSQSLGAPSGDNWHMAGDFADSDLESVTNISSNSSQTIKWNKTTASPIRKTSSLIKIVEDSDSDAESIISNVSKMNTSKKSTPIRKRKTAETTTLTKVVEDSDWDEAEILD